MTMIRPSSDPTPGPLFESQCDPPFKSGLELSTSANDTCGEFGDAGDEPDGPHALQNAAKNNLCAKGDPDPALVTFATFRKLQAVVVEQNLTHFSASKLPDSREDFHELVTATNHEDVGEGTLVSLVAYVAKVKRGGKESVNCKVTKGRDLLDHHIVLVNSANDDECESITAEAIPHFRPAAWDAARIASPDVPMRFTGQLFFDASHKPCDGHTPKAGNPARFTSWEIHPVYAIDVCKFATKTKCKVDDPNAWTPLDQWEESEMDE
jgi:hypothetical protein